MKRNVLVIQLGLNLPDISNAFSKAGFNCLKANTYDAVRLYLTQKRIYAVVINASSFNNLPRDITNLLESNLCFGIPKFIYSPAQVSPKNSIGAASIKWPNVYLLVETVRKKSIA